MPIDFDSVKKSYGRCMLTHDAKQKFFSQFYERFLVSHPQISAVFKDTEFDRKVNVLKNAISMSMLFAEKQDELAKDVLTKIRNSHSRNKKNIIPEYYDVWLKCLIDTLRVCDPHFTDQLESHWREMMQISIDYLIEGY